MVAGSTATPAPSTPLGVPANDSTACNTTQRLVESVVPGCQFCENVQADQVCRVRGCVWSVPLKHSHYCKFWPLELPTACPPRATRCLCVCAPRPMLLPISAWGFAEGPELSGTVVDQCECPSRSVASAESTHPFVYIVFVL